MSEKLNIPKTIGVIMDGNRRWAKDKGLPVFKGHEAGSEKLKEVVTWAKDVGVENLIFYTFSTENWNRAKDEVSYLLNLIGKMVEKYLEEFNKEGGILHFVGDISAFPENLQKTFIEAREKTKNNKGPNVYLALNYGGRAEILSAVKKIVSDNPSPESVTEEYFAKFLHTYPMPDPDIIIRTSGEMRLSGFLPWQGVYSELFFTKTFWPDFSNEEFLKIIEEYNSRDRRIGR